MDHGTIDVREQAISLLASSVSLPGDSACLAWQVRALTVCIELNELERKGVLTAEDRHLGRQLFTKYQTVAKDLPA